MPAAVIDTMVFSYALLGEPQFREESIQLLGLVERPSDLLRRTTPTI